MEAFIIFAFISVIALELMFMGRIIYDCVTGKTMYQGALMFFIGLVVIFAGTLTMFIMFMRQLPPIT